MLKLPAVPLLLALTTGACHGGPIEIRTTRVLVSKAPGGIRIENLTDKGMGYFLVDQGVVAVIEWAPCTKTTPDCLRLPAHGTLTVKLADIAAYSTSTKSVAAYTWWIVDNGNGTVSADIAAPAILKLR